MRIYFEDDILLEEILIRDELYSDLVGRTLYIVDAGKGPARCVHLADVIKKHENDKASVYTNSLELFSNIYAWNEQLKAPEIYVRHAQTYKFIRLDELTPRELRKCHNLRKLYIAGEFAKQQGLPW